MKKLFISVPFKDRTDDNILESFIQMHKIAEEIYGEKLEVIQSFLQSTDNIPVDARINIWCLGRSIQKLAEADYYIGIISGETTWNGTTKYNGCAIENEIARRYNIPCKFIDPSKFEFLKDI